MRKYKKTKKRRWAMMRKWEEATAKTYQNLNTFKSNAQTQNNITPPHPAVFSFFWVEGGPKTKKKEKKKTPIPPGLSPRGGEGESLEP
jgi:hypothetical protein